MGDDSLPTSTEDTASDPTLAAQPGKRLAVFLDGTWNKRDSNTNVWRLRLMLADRGADGIPQEAHYDEGVGTRWYEHMTGGAFGFGLSKNVLQAYCWLLERYNPGDEIYIFGFSRGAFTARSLAGLIARCGLLMPSAPLSPRQIYDRYRVGDKARPIYSIKYWNRDRPLDFEETVLRDQSHYGRNLIKMVGVWDTVGSLGIPFGKIKGISRRTLRFHNTNLSTTVQHSYQALALDEYRKPYWAILWTHFEPDAVDESPPPPPVGRRVEQRWFSGAHANVGGGYPYDLLAQRPLAWMQRKAEACGLAFRSHVAFDDEEDLRLLPRDSYREFLRGVWRVVKFGRRYVRWVFSDRVKKKARPRGRRKAAPGTVYTVNERIDESVFRRCQRHPSYRPLSLLEWAGRWGFDLEALIRDPERFRELLDPVVDEEVGEARKPQE